MPIEQHHNSSPFAEISSMVESDLRCLFHVPEMPCDNGTTLEHPPLLQPLRYLASHVQIAILAVAKLSDRTNTVA